MQQSLSRHQHAAAEWRVHLVGREGEIVDPARFHLDLAMGDQLRRIHQQARSIAMHDAADLRQIVVHAEDIRCAAHGHQLDALLAVLTLLVVGAQERFQLVQIHKAVGVHPQSDVREAAQRAPRQFVRVVFKDRVHHDRLAALARIRGSNSRPPG